MSTTAAREVPRDWGEVDTAISNCRRALWDALTRGFDRAALVRAQELRALADEMVASVEQSTIRTKAGG